MSFTPLFALVLLAVTASAQLSLTVSGPGSVDGVENLKVVAKLTNTGSETLKLLNTPQGVLSKLPTDTFTITSAEGQSPMFSGVKAKYALEKAISTESFTILEAGKFIDLNHDLSKMYNFTSTGFGDYKIEPSNLFYEIDAFGQLNTITADVTPLSSKITGGNLAVARNSQLKRRATFSGCDDDAKLLLKAAGADAKKLAIKAQTSLQKASNGTTTAYRKWFGEWTAGRYATVNSHFNNLAAENFTDWHYDCSSCDKDDVYAFVYPNDHGRIFICGSFWSLQLHGINSEPGALLGQASVFTKNGGTDRYATGTTASKKLASDDARFAVINEDSHQYYAEDLV